MLKMTTTSIPALPEWRQDDDNSTSLYNTTTEYTFTTSIPISPQDEQLQLVTRILTMVNLAILMFGLGCSIQLDVVKKFIFQPKQFVTGICLQLLLMPFLGLFLTQLFQMTQAEALGVIIQSSCPGGTYSNIISYWLDGNLNLSIVMTTTSTILALGTLPLWLYTLPRIFNTSDHIHIPFNEIGYALLGSLVPILFGLIVHYKLPKKSTAITKVCTVFASLSIFICAIVIAILNKREVVISWRQVMVAIFLPIIALLIGYIATLAPCLEFTTEDKRTVAIETAMQNSGLGVTIVLISISTTSPYFITVFLFPAMYGTVQMFGGAVAIVSYLIFKWRGITWFLPKDGNFDSTDTLHEMNDVEYNGLDNPAFTDSDNSLPRV